MGTTLSQLVQWPPKTSTVIGLGLLIGAADYLFFGNVSWALLIAGAIHLICPEDASAADKLTDLLGQLPAALSASKKPQ